MPKCAVTSLLVFLSLGSASVSQERAQAFVGARILPISSPEIVEGVLLIEGGKISAIGPASSTPIPPGAERHDVRGMLIMPGLIDTHSHIGSVEGGDSTAPIQPDVRVLDSVNVRDERIQKAQAGGITTANVMPGSGHLLSGQTIYLKLKDGNIIDALAIQDSQGNIVGGIKMANGFFNCALSPRLAPLPVHAGGAVLFGSATTSVRHRWFR